MIRFSVSEKIFAAIATLVSVIVGLLTLLAEKASDTFVLTCLFYPLLPGIFTGLLITGPHGGTPEVGAICVAAAVNIFCYLLIPLFPYALWRYLMSQRTPSRKEQ